MSNFYAVIIILYTLSGLFGAIFSGLKIKKAKKCAAWPSVKGLIIGTTSAAEAEDSTPRVEYRYRVSEQDYKGSLKFASSDIVLPELTAPAVEKHPINGTLEVYYNPQSPADSVLETGIKKDDWFIFSLGVGALVSGTLFLVFNL